MRIVLKGYLMAQCHLLLTIVCHYQDNKNRGFTRLNIRKKKKKTLLTDSIYISIDYTIIRRYNRLSITNKFEIKLLPVRRGGRERESGWRRGKG
jgi:hypothetical protein